MCCSGAACSGRVCDAQWMQTHKLPKVVLDRQRASLIREAATAAPTTVPVVPPPQSAQAGTMFGQLFRQLRYLAPSALRNSERAFYTEFVGEHADDYGGPYREALSFVCGELMAETPMLSLLQRCPNGRDNLGQNKDRFVPLSGTPTAHSLASLEFLGVLIGVAIRTSCPLEITLPSLVWKPMVGDVITPADVECLHESHRNVMARLRELVHDPSMDPDKWKRVVEKINLRFVTTAFDGSELELFPGGASVPVPWTSRLEYLDMVDKARIRECASQTAAIVRGLATQVPIHVLSLFTWHEIELMVCGNPTVDLELLKVRHRVRVHTYLPS